MNQSMSNRVTVVGLGDFEIGQVVTLHARVDSGTQIVLGYYVDEEMARKAQQLHEQLRQAQSKAPQEVEFTQVQAVVGKNRGLYHVRASQIQVTEKHHLRELATKVACKSLPDMVLECLDLRYTPEELEK